MTDIFSVYYPSAWYAMIMRMLRLINVIFDLDKSIYTLNMNNIDVDQQGSRQQINKTYTNGGLLQSNNDIV